MHKVMLDIDMLSPCMGHIIFARLIALLLLLQYNGIIFMYKSHSFVTMLFSQMAFLDAADRAMFSAFVVLVATIGCLLLHHDTTLLPIMNIYTVVDLQPAISPA